MEVDYEKKKGIGRLGANKEKQWDQKLTGARLTDSGKQFWRPDQSINVVI